jgi:glutaredoxin 3
MPANVTVYTTSFCPYCVQAKALLKKKSVPFTEIDVESRPELRTWLIDRSKQRTVPQIFVNGQPLGGFTDIAALDRAGRLDPLLSRDPSPEDPEVRV